MKFVLILTFFAFLLSSPANSNNSVQGVWQLISGEYLNHRGEIVQYSDLNLRSTKIVSGNHFSFVTMSGDKFWSAGSGLYKITADHYIEQPTLKSFQSSKDKEYRFRYEIDGDLWRTSRWENNIRVEYEVWQRKTERF